VRVYPGCKAMLMLKAALKAPDSDLGIPKADEFESTRPLSRNRWRRRGAQPEIPRRRHPRAHLGCGRTADPIGPGRNADRSGGVISD